MNNDYDQFVCLLQERIPSNQIIKFQGRSLATLKGIVLKISDLSVFNALWGIVEIWINKHSNASIKISYKSNDGKQVEITYNKLSKTQVEEIISQNPPLIGCSTRIILP